MKMLLHALFCSLIIPLSVTSRAEFSDRLLPHLGSLAVSITMSDKSKVEEDVHDANGRISANLPALDTARGRAADDIAAMLSGDSEALRQKLREAFLSEREQFVKNLADDDFAIGDMGVAYAVSYVVLWELASNRVLPPAASKRAAMLTVHAMHRYKDKYASFSDGEKAMAYDWLITTPVALASLVMAFEKEGRLKDANMLREWSALLFLKTFRLPHDMLQISQSGEISVDVGALLTYQ